MESFHRRNFERRWKIVVHCIEQKLHAFVFQRGSAHNRKNIHTNHRASECRFDLFYGKLFASKILVHQRFIGFGKGFQKFSARFLRQLKHVRRNFAFLDLLAELVLVHLRLHVDEIDDSDEIRFCSDRKLNGICAFVETRSN